MDGLVKAGENGRLPPAHGPTGSYGNKAKPKRNRDSQSHRIITRSSTLLPGSTSSSVDLLQLLPSLFLYKGKEEAGLGGGGGEGSMT